MDKIEIPFGAYDSETLGWTYTIPNGYTVKIEDGKIVVKKEELEDEKIRKELIDFIQWAEDRGMTRHDYHQAKRPAVWIAYLEKQKEVELTEEDKKIIPEALVMLCDDIINHRVHTPIKTNEEGARKIKTFLKTINRQPHKSREEWEKQKPAEWSEFDRGVLEDAICATDLLGNGESFNKGNPNLAKAFRIAKDWLKSLPERFNLQPKQEWSEEDEKMFKNIRDLLLMSSSNLNSRLNGRIDAIGDREYSSLQFQIAQCLSWLEYRLKSLRPQPKVELTLLDENIIEAAVAFVEQNDHFNVWRGIDKHTVLKALRSLKPHWKPSEEQMGALKEALETYKGFEEYDAMKSLYNELKKLM